MLKVTIHSGLLKTRSAQNVLAELDIAYKVKSPVATFMVGLAKQGCGQTAPGIVTGYPRWSSSLWDLTARALAQGLYQRDQIEPSGAVDRRCAYATRICAAIEHMTTHDRGNELATVEILQRGKQRGLYTATFNEDLLGVRTADFEFGRKKLEHAELLLRAICWTYFGADILGPKPGLILPNTIMLGGVELFHVPALPEPAQSGFRRYQAARKLAVDQDDMARGEDYVRFLKEG
jgi:hypothetical protein